MEAPEKPPRKPNHDSRFIAQAMRYTTLAFQFVISIGILGYIGLRLDEANGWSPWGLLGGLLLGMGLGLFMLIRQLEKLNR